MDSWSVKLIRYLVELVRDNAKSCSVVPTSRLAMRDTVRVYVVGISGFQICTLTLDPESNSG